MKLVSAFLGAVVFAAGCATPPSPPVSKEQRSADRMIQTSESTLAPVYAPLADYLAEELKLGGQTGVGIDLGSGPGTLIVELCQRTRMHWINADINPAFFAYFYRLAEAHGVADRVSAVYADAQALPFRDEYADVIVSRGCYHFWPDRAAGFHEVYRVLKPGGVAYIGRGFPPNLPVATAKAIRDQQKGMWTYDPVAEGKELADLLHSFGAQEVKVEVPQPPGSEGVSYGVWVEFRKPLR